MFAIQTVNCVSDQSSTSTFLILCKKGCSWGFNLHARKQRDYVELASSEKLNSNHESSLRSPPPVAVLTRARSGSGDPGSPAARSVKLSKTKGHILEKYKMVSPLVPQIYSRANLSNSTYYANHRRWLFPHCIGRIGAHYQPANIYFGI